MCVVAAAKGTCTVPPPLLSFFLAGKSTPYLQKLYFRFKDEVFVGARPYPSEPFEKFLQQEFGADTIMTSIGYPR